MFFITALLLCAAIAVLYPYCQYYVDPDATAYLTISQRYAGGDWGRAINGYWSPWSCWLTGGLISLGLAAMPSAIVVNTIGALGFLYISFSLFRFFQLRGSVQAALGVSLIVFLAYAVFKQNFDDLWECFFLLAVLRVMLKDSFAQRPVLWVFIGFLGALAYFAKAYSFPFFILHTIVVSYIVFRKSQVERQWLKICIVSILTMVVCSSPWLYLLHEKYGVWTTGTAGKLNMSWYLVGHPYWKEGIQHLLPPPYMDAVYYWEDPWLVNGVTPQFWSSFKLFLLQMAKAAYNVLKFVNSANEISSFMLLVWLLSVAIVASDKVRYFFTAKGYVLAISFLLFPLGFILINFEARYIWYMLPLSMIVGALALQRILILSQNSRLLSNLIVWVFAASYIVWPLWDFRTILNVGKKEYQIAQALKAQGIRGPFTSRGSFAGGKVPAIARVAYFSGNAYYQIPGTVSDNDLLAEMKRYNIRYYFHFYDDKEDNLMLANEYGRLSALQVQGINGLQVYHFLPQ
jgi:hypothetical protein